MTADPMERVRTVIPLNKFLLRLPVYLTYNEYLCPVAYREMYWYESREAYVQLKQDLEEIAKDTSIEGNYLIGEFLEQKYSLLHPFMIANQQKYWYCNEQVLFSNGALDPDVRGYVFWLQDQINNFI